MKETKKKFSFESLLKLIPILYGIMFLIVLVLLLFFSGIPYYLKRVYLISDIFVLIPFFIFVFLFCRFYKDKEINDHNFKKILLVLFLTIGVLQIILIVNTYFYTSWDVKVIRELVNTYVKTGTVKEDYYLSVYPNNILLTAILAFIRKLPFIGKYYITTLIINAFLVNISGVFAALTIKNLKNSKAAIIGYIIMLPLVLLSPWINIPYSDTFALPCVTLLMYLYSKDKKLKDYVLIGFVSFVGYKIKPTVIILLIAIIIIEFISNIKNINKQTIKKYLKIGGVFIVGIVCGVLINKASAIYLRFKPVSYAKPFTFIHYLAMGQNDETLGAYSQQDKDDTIIYGKRNDLSKIKNRVLSRNFSQTVSFYSKKTLLNFNDGSFSWGLDGTPSFFYKKSKAPNNFAKFLRQIYYDDGKYYDLFLQVQNYIWLIVLLLCPFIIKKDNNKKEFVIMLSIFGLVLFLTLFEPRTRYMYCYSGIFIIAAVLGLFNLKNMIDSKLAKRKSQ